MRVVVIGTGLAGLTATALLSKAGHAVTALEQHAFGGCVPHVKIAPPPHETPVPGLWFVGAQSEVYGGVAGAMTGSKRVVERILDATR